MPQFFYVCIFAYECIGIYVEIRHSMEEPKHYFFVTAWCISIQFLIVLPLGFLCAFSFGAQTKEFVIFNLQAKGVNVVGYVSVLLTLCITFPLQLFPILLQSDH